jgi:hypothetical protein
MELIVVTGRQPGPPLWRVSNGDRQLYIFATFEPVPYSMVWESARVAAVLEECEEVILAPEVDAEFSLGLRLNPLNLVRGRRLAKRLTRLPDGATLEQFLPSPLYARFDALRSRYFPGDRSLDRLRPLVAGARLTQRIERQEGLGSEKRVIKPLRRLIRRQHHLEQTRIETTLSLKGSFSSLARRADELVGSLSQEQELACFDAQLGRLETDVEAMKRRANAWAEGYVDEFRGIPLPGGDEDVCLSMLRESSEEATLAALRRELDERWLAAAERALAKNSSTFAILSIIDLLRDDGPLAQLQARGYEIWEP